MGSVSLRSLLVAAIVLFDCISWTSSRHHYSHHTLRHKSRHRRQGAGLYLSSSHVVPGGEGGGAWGPWGEVSPCSRTCGGGVASQTRICLEIGSDGRPLCSGGTTKYFSCQTQDCPAGSKDFRAEQCSEYDRVSFKDVYYEWVPYTKSPKPCELNCKPRGERFYYRQKEKVVDGTRCDEESFDVCVDGTCQPVGCDMMLGSNAKEDKCRECRGNGTNCHTISGLIDQQDLTLGYNDVLLIPQGATSIVITEVRASNNYLAIRSKNYNQYYLNGEYHIDFPRSLLIAGALWQYDRPHQGFPAPDKLRCLGPTNEPLYLSILLQDVNVGIEYEYSIPTNMAPPADQQYNWVFDEFTPCNVTCGGGIQYRNVSCRSREDLEIVDESLCDEGMKPGTNQTCAYQACPAQWVKGPWSTCSKPCGQAGTRYRSVHCEKVITNGYPSIVNDSECFMHLGEKPETYEECNKDASCPVWFTGPWKPCDKLCDEGKQTRQVVCHQKINGKVQVFEDNECSDEKPATEQSCFLHPCEGVDWVLSEWTGCDSCLSKVRTRTVACATKDRKVVNSTFCENHQKPILEELCDRTKLPPCTVQWYATQWSNCSAQCGKGVQTRRLFCGLFDGESVIKVDDNRCQNETKYNDTKPCEIPEEKCPSKWFAGPWDECSKECGGGEQFRRVMCLRGSTEMKDCDPESILDKNQQCNQVPCDKDETLPVDSMSTPIMDEDYDEDCEEEDYDIADLEEESEETASTIDDFMFSDSPGTEITEEGSGSTAFTEETEFTSETGSGTEETTETLITETGSGETDITGDTESTDSTTESSSDSSTESSSSTDSSSESSTDASSDSSTVASSESSTDASASSDSSSESSTDSSSDLPTGTTEIGGSTETSSESSTDDSTTESGSTTPSDISTSESSTESSTDASTTESSTETTDSSSTTEDSSSTTDISSTESTTDITESTTESGTTESGSTETSESGSTETSETGSTETSDGSTTESGSTETSETGSTETSTTDSTDTSGTDSTETSVTGSTETSETGSTDLTSEAGTTETGSTDVTESTDATATTESGATEETDITGSTDISSTTETGSTEDTSATKESSATEETTTSWDWSSTIDMFTKRPRCKPRKKSKCAKSKFGCCPDKKMAAGGPFEEGCLTPKTCKDTKHGCCSDGVSPADGPNDKGCPLVACKETLYGCCKSDKKTPAQGNDQEGCPPPPPKCKSSKYGCCKDGKTAATGPKKKGCPETEKKKDTKKYLCFDNSTAASGPDGEGCPCAATEFGCCPDDSTPASGLELEGCELSCNTSAFGCCPDNQTPAHGPSHEGCCLLYTHGCCPDNYNPAEGPNNQGCGCQYAPYGCCPDNVTVATGYKNEGCGCKYNEFGCCPDMHTPAEGPNYAGCSCHTYQFGCCPDGSTVAKGPNQQGCQCQYSKYGCCGDEVTAASGPDRAGCDCASSKYGCCLDGQTEAKGLKFLGCTDIPENRQAACSAKPERGPCRNYTVDWFYDMVYGGCSRFWYGGCEGNGNRFGSQEECQDICVHPDPKDKCKLPKVKGACDGYNLRWFYDNDREQCGQFVYGGCLGNDNNFETRESCQKHCEPQRSNDQCSLPLEAGPCAGSYGRWGFDPDTKSCQQFTWGGCGGNGNRFVSEAACVMKCDPPGALKPKCSAEEEKGNCTKKLARWSFSDHKNRCVPFYYTGCGGNENNFQTREECDRDCPSRYVKDTCSLPAETGECDRYTDKWYFDTTDKRCRQFYYGGCGGNGNNFNTEQECEARCKDLTTTTTTPVPDEPESFRQEFCFLERDAGPCRAWEPRWAYDPARGECSVFQYGGCGGNRNNFPSQEYCSYYCRTVQDICQLPMSAGPCDASLQKYFYDAATDSCSQFMYGGCEGNDNRFDTREQCESRCRTSPGVAPTPTATTPTVQEEIPSECRVPSSLESCSSPGTVWYYDPSQRQCAAHVNQYSGRQCRHTNVFTSSEACERTCATFRGLEVCRYPVDAGPCHEFEPKVFFNESSQTCERFTYGGCHGGPNRFSSVEECQEVCRPDPCSQEQDPGSCSEYNTKWYYQRGQDECAQFVYTGCGGNGNNFDTKEECEGRCKQTPVPAEPQPEPVPEECRTPESLSPCGDNVTVFYWDENQRSCQRDDDGGCRRPNAYASVEQCERRCGAFKDLDVCRYGLDPGPCRDIHPKFFFDAVTSNCQPFNYGGCHGGPNRFSTIEECTDVCGTETLAPQCKLAPASGAPCELPATRRWYYSLEDDACYVFAYNGCEGNENNFVSYQQCLAFCKPGGNDLSCDQYERECSAIVCASGVLRTRSADGCEVCSCAPSDCSAYQRVCDELNCNYGVSRSRTAEGCEECTCIQHPCAAKECPDGDRCVFEAYSDPITRQQKYTTDCRTVNKNGTCPQLSAEEESDPECRRECNDDADCRGLGKCCASGCSFRCLLLSYGPRDDPFTTTHAPELPQAPQANPAETPAEVVSAESGRATIRCVFNGNPPPKIIWQRGQLTIDGTVGRYRLLSDGALEIVSLYRNDSGVYICIADNGLGRARQEINLQVTDPVAEPAAIAGEPGEVMVGELGQSLVIRCLAYGYPVPAIAWYRGATGPMVPYSSRQYEARGLTLQINVLELDTLGEYECQAYNGIGKPASWPVLVQAYGDAGADSPYVVPREGPPAVARPPPPPPPRPAAPTQPPVYSVPVTTQLRPVVQTYDVGSELSLACDVDGYPTPSVRWTKDGIELLNNDRATVTDSRLTVYQLKPEDSGEYACEAANRYSESKDRVAITVQGQAIPAWCTDNPFFANCKLILNSKYCHHSYYSGFCCKSCVEDGQITLAEIQEMRQNKRQ